jgi:hypothetical protein
LSSLYPTSPTQHFLSTEAARKLNMQLRASLFGDDESIAHPNGIPSTTGPGCGAQAAQARSAISSPHPAIIQIYAGKLFDSESRVLLLNCIISVSIESGLILSVAQFDPFDDINQDDGSIDLRNATVVPGFVDAHVHCKLTLLTESTRSTITSVPC